MRTLGGEENLGNIAEAGAKVVFQEPGSDRLWVAGKDPVIKVYELTKPSQPAHVMTSHSEWVAAVELYAPGVVATASADKTIRVWKLPSLKVGCFFYASILVRLTASFQVDALQGPSRL